MANDLESSIRELAESRARKVELAEWLTSGLRARASEPAALEAPPLDDAAALGVAVLDEAAHSSDAVLDEAAHSSDAVLDGAAHSSDAALDGAAHSSDAALDGAAHSSDAALDHEVEIAWMSQAMDVGAAAAVVTTASTLAAAGAYDAPAQGAPPHGAALSDELTPRVPGVESGPASETPDTLQPHLLSQDLDDDDFAVLPSKPSLRVLGSAFGKVRVGVAWQAVQRRPALKRSLAAAAVVLLLGALTLVRHTDAPGQIQTELAAVQPEASAQPLPPVEEVLVEATPASVAPTSAHKGSGRRRPTPAFSDATDDSDGPRGPNVARYPDLPNRVLSRLAQTQGTARRSEPEPEPEAQAASGEEKPTWLIDLNR